jgi:hypothetical protein
MKPLTSLGLAATVAIAISSLLGCTASRSIVNRVTSSEGGKLYAVGVEKAAFYRYGPQQGNGPDQELPRDTLVRLVRNSFGYSKVVLEPTGTEGYIASEDLTVASASLIASVTATPAPEIATSSSPAENLDVQSFDPGTMPPPEGLPAPDLPPSSPESSPLPL